MTGPRPEAHPADERAYRLRATLSGATLVMVGLSWPLWVDLADFPAVPFVRGFPDYPRSWSWAILGLVVAGLGLGMTRQFGRVAVGATVVVMTWLVLGDQLRFQPWVYQFLVMGSLLVVLPSRPALGFSRAYLASVYFYSGLSKLDLSFVREMGPTFLGTIERILRLDLSIVSGPRRVAAIYAMPAAEMLVAVLLLGRRTRVVGYLGAVLIHAALLLILGPWGLGHSTIVLVWNVALVAEEFFLFWPTAGGTPGPWSGRWRERIVGVPFALVLLLPLSERSGRWDSWPSHALYASHCERTTLVVRDEALGSLPGSLRRAVSRASDPTSGWRSFSPTAWTLAVRGVPAYPQARYANGLGEWVAAKIGRDGPLGFRLIHASRADWRTDRRAVRAWDGLEEIRDAGDRFWFNAHPRDRSRR